jgi:tetratricopeptide (TPR) repeat protein
MSNSCNDRRRCAVLDRAVALAGERCDRMTCSQLLRVVLAGLWIASCVIPLTLADGLAAGAARAGPAPAAPAPAASGTLRPEVGKPLQEAETLINDKKFVEALAKVNEADNARNKTAHEIDMIERIRGIAAAGTGDVETAARSFEAVLSAGRLPAADRLQMMQTVAGLYYRRQDYSRAILWGLRYLKDVPDDKSTRMLVIRSYFLAGDFTNARSALQACRCLPILPRSRMTWSPIRRRSRGW